MSSPTFVLLSFEGPDRYSHAGGLGTRVTELSKALATAGFETHLFFVGEPELPGYETLCDGKLHMHRWCQWISRYHPAGVYDGQDEKLWDWDRSLPEWLGRELLAPKAAAGEHVVVLGEEWQTAATMTILNTIVNSKGWGETVHLLWNANNTFAFERIDWAALNASATITTVSRYMKHLMWTLGVDAEVVPNGIPEHWLEPVARKSVQDLPQLFRDRLAVVKVARWDPDKRWEMAVDAVAGMKEEDLRPMFLARGGGMEPLARDIVSRAERRGLTVRPVDWKGSSVDDLVSALRPAAGADMLLLQGYLSEPQRRVLFRNANAILANSGREPFGLVGLETMAVGGVAMVGSTGEDYVTPGHDAIALQTNDPKEIVSHLSYLSRSKDAEQRMRQEARRSAARYTWPAVIRRVLFPFLTRLGVPCEPSLEFRLDLPSAGSGVPLEPFILPQAKHLQPKASPSYGFLQDAQRRDGRKSLPASVAS